MSEIFIGANTAANVYVGSNLAEAVYLGAEKVWPSAPVTPPTGGGASSKVVSCNSLTVVRDEPLPKHSAGDLLLIFVTDQNWATPSVPAAGGTVPAWTTLDTSDGSTMAGCTIAYAVASASNHTSGIWTGFGTLAVLSPGFTTPDQSDCQLNFGEEYPGAEPYPVVAPEITLADPSGKSTVLRFYYGCGDFTQSGWTNPSLAGCRILVDQADSTTATRVVEQTDTTTAPDLTDYCHAGSGITSYAAATIEIAYP